MIDLALCKSYKNQDLKKEDWYIEPKLDGVRCGILYKDDTLKIVSRNNKPFYNMDMIETDLLYLIRSYKIPDNTLFDGELLATNWNDTISIVHSKKEIDEKIINSLSFYIFDMVYSLNDLSYQERRIELNEHFSGHGHIKILKAESLRNLNEQHKNNLANRYEGSILKNIHAKYPYGKRSPDWLKHKPTQTYDVKIVDFIEGKGKYVGMLGAFICEYDKVQFEVGCGFIDEERNKYWKQRNSLLGKVIEIKCQEMTKTKRPRFPVFLKMRIDK